MQIHVVAVGTRMPTWVNQAYQEYAKRLPAQFRLQLREVAPGRRGKNADIERVLRDEGARLLAAVPRGCRVVALERNGRQMDTPGLAAELTAHCARGEDLALLIGGPEGLAPQCRLQAEKTSS